MDLGGLGEGWIGSMSPPKRIQRQRAKGWRMPEGAIYVGRPTQWGNSFRIGDAHPVSGKPMSAADAYSFYEAVTLQLLEVEPAYMAEKLKALEGKDLACWCRLDQPCHADLLLRLANEGAAGEDRLGIESVEASADYRAEGAQLTKGKKNNTATSAFGSSKREGHDASSFYARALYAGIDAGPVAENAVEERSEAIEAWVDKMHLGDARRMAAVPSGAVALAFTSPPYNVGKEYDADLSLDAYRDLLRAVASEVHRVLMPGGRYVVNVANLGRKPYLALNAMIYQDMSAAGWLPMGEIIWQKAKGAGGNCAWGSWKSAKAPRLRDIHEYLLVFAKGAYARADKGESDIGRDEFMAATLSIWNIAPESAKRIGHPAPFPVALADRVIRLFSYRDDVVLDPFAGSGTTLVAAKRDGRHFVGYDTEPAYIELANARLNRTDALK